MKAIIIHKDAANTGYSSREKGRILDGVKHLLTQGSSLKAACERMNVCYPTVFKWLQKKGPVDMAASLKKAISDYDAGHDLMTAADSHAVSRDLLRTALKKRGRTK